MHEQHRQRMKQRFLAEGLDHFEPHNVLELLLFYTLPQKDTNEIAHALIDRFGSLAGVFDADFNELVTVPGIKEHSAVLIKMIPQLARLYFTEKNQNGSHTLRSLDAIGNYFVQKYVGVNVETVYLLLLDNKFGIIDCAKVHEGSVNSAAISVRKIVDFALRQNASMAVLAHNHPSGIAIPSADDLFTTTQVKSALDLMEIKMLAHILVAGNRYIDILNPKK